MCPIPVRDDGLQIDDNAQFQRRFWRVERLAWLIYGLFILAALVGLTGDGGHFARAERIAGGLEVSYPAISRWRSQEDLAVRLPAGAGSRDLRVDAGFLAAFDVLQITPAPETAQALPDGLRWTFRAQPGRPAKVSLLIEARRPGRLSYRLDSGDGATLRLSTLVLP